MGDVIDLWRARERRWERAWCARVVDIGWAYVSRDNCRVSLWLDIAARGELPPAFVSRLTVSLRKRTKRIFSAGILRATNEERRHASRTLDDTLDDNGNLHLCFQSVDCQHFPTSVEPGAVLELAYYSEVIVTREWCSLEEIGRLFRG